VVNTALTVMCLCCNELAAAAAAVVMVTVML